MKLKEAKQNDLAQIKKEHFRLLDEEWQKLIDPATGLVFKNLVNEVACPVCEKEDFTTVFIKRGFTFVRCQHCSHVFLNPQPKSKLIQDHFRFSPAWQLWWEKVLFNESQLAFDRERYRDAIQILESVCGVGEGRSVLDVGCASGIFLDLIQQKGWQPFGLEVSEEACKVAKERFGLDVINQSFEDYQASRKYDLITFWAALEYHTDVRNIVSKVSTMLKPNGYVLFFVGGNSNSLVMRVLRENWSGFLFNRSHSFNPDSLQVLMNEFDFERAHQSSILAEVDSILRYLEHQDPFDAKTMPASLSAVEKNKFEEFILKNQMGYKFTSIFRRKN